MWNPVIIWSSPTGPLEHVHLSVPFVAIRNKEVNVTAVVWPSQSGTLTYFWWFGNSTKVRFPTPLLAPVSLRWFDGNKVEQRYAVLASFGIS